MTTIKAITNNWALLCFSILFISFTPCKIAAQTFDVIIDTDLGGDPDDIQSLFRAVHYSDVLKIKGIVSTPNTDIEHHPWDTLQHTTLIKDWIKRIDVDHLRANGYNHLMTESELLSLVKSGSNEPGNPSTAKSSEGSQWIVEVAKNYTKENPLYILVWGSMTTMAQALFDAPDIAGNIRMYYISSSNTLHDPASRDFVFEFMQNEYPELWWIENGILPKGTHETFRGVYQSGIQDGEWGYTRFTAANIRNHGSTHNGLFKEKCGDVFPLANYPKHSLKEGDSPSILYLIAPVIGQLGNVNDPTQENWGGQFRHFNKDRYPNYYVDLDKSPEECQYTIGKWRYDVMNDWKLRWDRYDTN
ncbi:inosine-uridine preferring nucleoside hydrolase [Flavobacteriaceae bacterium MAR_2009_75]|nr:inosine-uridine preferring nucleoside hydrolase [Flavobacteriaceae bacterium MAR_2009_75]